MNPKKSSVRVALGLTATASVSIVVVAMATGTVGGSNASSDGNMHAGNSDGNPYQETVPCTGSKKPVNFEVFSAGPAPAGLPLTGTSRRCDTGAPSWGWPNNYVHYSYGTCQIPVDATGCYKPLQVQTWPACQRARNDYTFEGKPLPYRTLSKFGDAVVVEFTFPADRIEVYTRAATIVIFANDRDLARKAVRLLRPQGKGETPATNPDALVGARLPGLGPPSPGSMQGDLPCHT